MHSCKPIIIKNKPNTWVQFILPKISQTTCECSGALYAYQTLKVTMQNLIIYMYLKASIQTLVIYMYLKIEQYSCNSCF